MRKIWLILLVVSLLLLPAISGLFAQEMKKVESASAKFLYVSGEVTVTRKAGGSVKVSGQEVASGFEVSAGDQIKTGKDSSAFRAGPFPPVGGSPSATIPPSSGQWKVLAQTYADMPNPYDLRIALDRLEKAKKRKLFAAEKNEALLKLLGHIKNTRKFTKKNNIIRYLQIKGHLPSPARPAKLKPGVVQSPKPSRSSSLEKVGTPPPPRKRTR